MLPLSGCEEQTQIGQQRRRQQWSALFSALHDTRFNLLGALAIRRHAADEGDVHWPLACLELETQLSERQWSL